MRLRLAAFVVVAVLVMCVGSTVDRSAAAEPDSWQTVEVPAAGISIGLPSTWVVEEADTQERVDAMRRYLNEHPNQARVMGLDADSSVKETERFIHGYLRKTPLLATDPLSGDNVQVGIERGPWYDDLDDFRAGQEMSAKLTGAKVLSVHESRVGKRQAFTEFEEELAGGTGLAAGWMEIEAGKNRSISITVTVARPNLATAKAIVRSVAPPR